MTIKTSTDDETNPIAKSSSSSSAKSSESSIPSASAAASASFMPSTKHAVIAGAAGGGMTRLLAAPFDLVKIRFQMQQAPISCQVQGHPGAKYVGLLQAIRSIHAEEGLRTFWRGNISATYLWISYSSVQFGTISCLQRLYPTEFVQDHPALVKTSSGALAGIVATTITYPFDLFRTIFASQGIPKRFATMEEVVRHIYRLRGVRGFYRGLSPTLVQIAPYMGFSFGIYSSLNRVSSQHNQQGSMAWLLASMGNGAIAGFLSKLAVYPFDTVKKRMQMRNIDRPVSYGTIPAYQSSWQCFQHVMQTEGICRGLYKGTLPSLFKAVVTHSSTYATYETTLYLLGQYDLGNHD